MASHRPTRADVAKLAGVAASTVGLVLQNRGDELKIPERTQDRIRDAARAIGYSPNKHIQSVLRGRSGIIGIYLRYDQWARPMGYWATVRWHLERVFANSEVQLLVHNATEGLSTEEAFARQTGGIVDGVIILNSGKDPIVGRLLEAKIHAVELGDDFSLLPSVGLSSQPGIELGMTHLRDQGYRVPSYLGHESNYSENAISRVLEYQRNCKCLFGGIGTNNLAYVSEDFTLGLDRLLSMDPKPDCVLCGSDELAYTLLGQCLRRGIRVPDDLAIVGFDALETMGSPMRLTSISTPIAEAAELAFQKLMAMVEGQPYERTTVLPSGLCVGETT